ncbi:MAG: Gfo/Idh/MocA family oxidoreductase [Phycisphaeraceae bacterium]
MKRYAVVGMSNRAIAAFIKPLVERYGSQTRIVAMLDRDPLRFKVAHQRVPALPDVPTFDPEQFDQMVDQTRPDVVLVTTTDDAHERYTVAALKRDLDVVVEKPMTINCRQAQAVLDAQAASRGTVTVTHNMRYRPHHQQLKRMLMEGRVGRITNVDFNYYCDSYHGASYFKRWNRQRSRSGGLTIHKSTHHFDFINWLIDQDPQQVFAYSALNYYGPDGEMNPIRKDGRHCQSCDERKRCAYEMRWPPLYTNDAAAVPAVEEHLLPIRVGTYSDYRPDQCIFDSQIDIEDTYVATVRYSGGAMMSYSVNFSVPYEGYRLAINGTRGRLETSSIEPRGTFTKPPQDIAYYPLFGGGREIIEPLQNAGGHGGSDPLLLEELILGPDPQQPYSCVGTARAGAMAVAVGEAIWRSAKDNRPYNIADLLTVDVPVSARPAVATV